MVELARPVSELGLGTARGMLNTGRELYAYLAHGGKLRAGRLLRPPAQQRAALLATVVVDGQPPTTAEQLAAALEYLEAEVAAVQLVEKWAAAQVSVPSAACRNRGTRCSRAPIASRTASTSNRPSVSNSPPASRMARAPMSCGQRTSSGHNMLRSCAVNRFHGAPPESPYQRHPRRPGTPGSVDPTDGTFGPRANRSLARLARKRPLRLGWRIGNTNW